MSAPISQQSSQNIWHKTPETPSKSSTSFVEVLGTPFGISNRLLKYANRKITNSCSTFTNEIKQLEQIRASMQQSLSEINGQLRIIDTSKKPDEEPSKRVLLSKKFRLERDLASLKSQISENPSFNRSALKLIHQADQTELNRLECNILIYDHLLDKSLRSNLFKEASNLKGTIEDIGIKIKSLQKQLSELEEEKVQSVREIFKRLF